MRPGEYEAVDALAKVTVDALRQWGATDESCILGTSTLVHAARSVGIGMRAVPAVAFAGNRRALNLMLDGVPKDLWPDNAWTVAVDTRDQSSSRAYPGHLVAMDAYGRLVDTTSDQFSRPWRDMIVPAPVVLQTDDAWGRGEWIDFQTGNVVVAYKHLANPLVDYRLTGAWQQGKEAAPVLMTAVRESLEKVWTS